MERNIFSVENAVWLSFPLSYSTFVKIGNLSCGTQTWLQSRTYIENWSIVWRSHLPQLRSGQREFAQRLAFRLSLVWYPRTGGKKDFGILSRSCFSMSPLPTFVVFLVEIVSKTCLTGWYRLKDLCIFVAASPGVESCCHWMKAFADCEFASDLAN